MNPLDQIPRSKIETPVGSDYYALMLCPPLPGFERGSSSRKSRPVAPSEHQLYRFRAPSGELLADSTGRRVFVLVPSAADRLAASLGAVACRV